MPVLYNAVFGCTNKVRQSAADSRVLFNYIRAREVPCVLHVDSTVNWNTSKGNQAPIQKFERPNRKIPKSKKFLTSVSPALLKSSMKRFL